MAVITLAAALLLFVSAGLKVRSGRRVGVGFSVLAIVEIAYGFIFAAGAVPGVLSQGFLNWALPTGLLLLFVSTGEHAQRLKKHRLFRERSEAARLQTFLQVRAEADDAD